jgi:hypothetical protein
MKHSEIMVGLMKHGSYASLLQSYEVPRLHFLFFSFNSYSDGGNTAEGTLP